MNEICKDCKWNKYPNCLGTILEDGSYLNIESGIEKEGLFECGVKYKDTPMDFSIIPKTLEERVKELEEKVNTLEANKT